MASKSDRERYIAENSEYSFNEDLFTFSLVDASTVDRLRRDGDIDLPKRKVNVPKDERWNTKQMTSKLMQGILNGDSIPKISESLLDVIHNNDVSATRAARTLVTQAENHGRLDSYKTLDEQGVVQEKVWIATPDSRTRASHLDVDGETVGINDTFSNGLEYPADPSGDPAEVYNCRCSMRTEIVGFRRADGSISRVDYERDDTMHEGQMDEERGRRGIEPKPKEEKETKASDVDTSYVPMNEENQKYYENLMKYMDVNNVKYKEVEELTKTLTEEEIIEKLAGADQTVGSCASLALAYCGNKLGLDVTDFRGGNSQKAFSMMQNWLKASRTANASVKFDFVKKEARDVAKVIKTLELDKQYMLVTGRHAAIIKNTSDGLKYLEMQSSQKNGWRDMEYTKKTPWGEYKNTVADTLYNRFGCRKTTQGMYHLMEVDSYQKTKEFKQILGYINTNTGEQKKGAGGGIK